MSVTFYSGPGCDNEGSFDGREFVIGKCLYSSRERDSSDFMGMKRESKGASSLFLKNGNDSYVSPQPPVIHDPSYPYVPTPIPYSCDSLDNCSYDGVYATSWTTEFDDFNCTSPLSSYAFHNISYGIFYATNQYGSTYVRLECAGPHETRSSQFVGNGCETLILRSTVRNTCGPRTQYRTTCTAPPPSDNPIAPSSSSSLRSSLFSLAFLFAILVMATL